MKRILLLTISLLAVDGARLAGAQETGAGNTPAWDAFQALSRKNIFDPNRVGAARYNSKPHVPVIRTFTFGGTAGDVAFLYGDGAPRRGWVKVGDSVNGFKVMKITLDEVKLTDPTGNIVVLKQDESMRREDEGAWAKSGERASVNMASAPGDLKPAGSTPAPSAGPADENERLRLLRLKREQEDK